MGELVKTPDEIIWEKFHIHAKDTSPYSPWLDSASRETLAELFYDLGYTQGAEIGVRSGYYSKTLMSKNPNLTLRCVDPWTPYLRVGQSTQEVYLRRFREKMSVYGDRVIEMRMTSMAAFMQIQDESLDFVYIDAVHEFDHCMMDIIMWSRKVRPGGIVSGHDYYVFYQSGVIAAANAYTSAHGITQWYITKEKEPSFFWVRPKQMSPGGFNL